MQAHETLHEPHGRRRLVGFLVALVLVIGILMGLDAWSESIRGVWGGPSLWQLRLIGAIGLAAILVLFWTALRAGRSVGWVFPVLLAVGATLHVYRIVVYGVLLPGADAFTTARMFFPDMVWLPLHLLFYFFAMGAWGILDRSRGRRASAWIGHLDLPIAGLVLFLLIHYALHAYVRWSGSVELDSGALWPVALGVSTVLRPVLLIGAFYLLNAVRDVPRKRPFEWALAGVLVGLVLTTPRYVIGSSLADWAADAAVDVAVIGLAAWLLPGTHRSGQAAATGEVGK